MSKQDQKALSNLYRSAPRLDSPDALDQRILQAAENHAPTRQNMIRHHWMPIAASACVAGIAIFVAMPLMEFDDHSTQRFEVNQDLQVETVMERESMSDTTPESLPAAPTARLTTRAKKKELNEAEMSVTKSSDQVSADFALGRSVETKAAKAASEPITEARSSLQSQRAASTAAVRQGLLPMEEIDRQLAEIRDLVDRQMPGQAQKLLDQLILRCPDCALPAKVAELE